MTAEEILRLHFQVIEDYGGSHGVRDEGRIQSVGKAPQQVVFGVEQYSDMVTKSAVYLHSLIAHHPFVDGNKRTALTACGVFLDRNGYKLTAQPRELEDFVVSIATEHLPIEMISSWIKAHVAA